MPKETLLEQREKELTAEIVKKIKMGCPRSTAAASAGITLDTLNRWLRKGAKGRQPFKRFCEALNKAEAELEGATAAYYLNGVSRDPMVARAFLRDRFPGNWAPKDTEAVKDMMRLLDILGDELTGKQYRRVIRMWDYRSTVDD